MRWRYSACGQRRFQHDSQTALSVATFCFLRLQSAVCDSRHFRWVTASLDISRNRPPPPPKFVIIMSASFPQLFTFQQNNNDKLYPACFMIICYLCLWPGSCIADSTSSLLPSSPLPFLLPSPSLPPPSPPFSFPSLLPPLLPFSPFPPPLLPFSHR